MKTGKTAERNTETSKTETAQQKGQIKKKRKLQKENGQEVKIKIMHKRKKKEGTKGNGQETAQMSK